MPQHPLTGYFAEDLVDEVNRMIQAKNWHIYPKLRRKQGTNVAHNIMGGLQIIAMFHL